jgi:peroxiredoxin Q/BCP
VRREGSEKVAPARRGAEDRRRRRTRSGEYQPPADRSFREHAMPLIEPGKKAPAFALKDQDGVVHRLSSYAGRPVVLYFYPKDDTSGCTAQACAMRDALPDFTASGAAVLGVSILDTKSKARFARKHGLNFPLLADDALDEHGKPSPMVAQKYGVWVEKSMYGRRYMGIERTTYLIGPDGKVVRRWDKVKVPGHAEEVLVAVRALG